MTLRVSTSCRVPVAGCTRHSEHPSSQACKGPGMLQEQPGIRISTHFGSLKSSSWPQTTTKSCAQSQNHKPGHRTSSSQQLPQGWERGGECACKGCSTLLSQDGKRVGLPPRRKCAQSTELCTPKGCDGKYDIMYILPQKKKGAKKKEESPMLVHLVPQEAEPLA